MLGSQDFSRSHHGGLVTVLRSKIGTGGGNHCLAGTNVPLQQPVHRDGPAQIGQAVVNRPLLGFGELEWEKERKIVHRGRVHRRSGFF